MNALEKLADLIEKRDVWIKDAQGEAIKLVTPYRRAEIAAVHLNAAYTADIPLTATLISIGISIFEECNYPEKVSKGDLIGAGFTVIRPALIEGLLKLQRQSQVKVGNAQLHRAGLFDMYQKTLRKGKEKGDWTAYMLADGDSDWVDELLMLAPQTAENPRARLYNHKPLEWDGFYHPEFGPLSSRSNKKVRKMFDGRAQNSFDAVNKLQSTKFLINENVYNRMLKDMILINEQIKENSDSSISTSSKMFEIRSIMKLAQENRGKDIYSPVTVDFRGRTYYSAKYLTRSGNDWSKGLLGVEPEVIGAEGYDNLLVAAIDFRDRGVEAKMSRADKLALAESQVDDFIAVANGADYLYATEPGQFLAVCYDIKGAMDMWMDYDQFKSGVLLSRDASQSGPMLMGIATQDEMAMKYTNVLEDTERHDLYEYMGGVMLELLKEKKVTPGELTDKPEETWKEGGWYKQNKSTFEAQAKEDFLKLFSEDPGAIRKWAKYPLMLFGYSAQELCIAEDLWNKMNVKYSWLTPIHCHFIADLFYKACEKAIPSVYNFMKGMKNFGSHVNKLGEDVFVQSTYGGFPFMQDYYEYESNFKNCRYSVKGKKQVIHKLKYKEKTDRRKASAVRSATPANLVHSIDSDLLKMVVNEFPHTIATNHDAFFATPGRINELDTVLRECTYKMASYDLVDNAIGRYGLKAEDLGIVINELNPKFNPLANEFCYS